MLGRVITKVINAGINDIIINVHHFAEQICEYVAQNKFDANITFSDESNLLLETGGGLRKALDLIGDETVLVHNADILTDFDLKKMISAHEESETDVTLLTSQRKTSRYFVFDLKNRLKGWTNITTGAIRPEGFDILPEYSIRAFNGVHIINPNVYTALKEFKSSEEPFSIVDFYIDYLKNFIIRSFELPGDAGWFDVGKPETLEKANSYIKLKKCQQRS